MISVRVVNYVFVVAITICVAVRWFRCSGFFFFFWFCFFVAIWFFFSACLSIIKLGLRMLIALLLKSRFYWSLHSRNLSSGVCEQPRCRPACASAQSDQYICYSLLIISNLVREKFQFFKLISVAERGGLNLTLSETL